MGMDSSDYRLVQDIKSASEDTLREIRELRRLQERTLSNDARLAEAFERVAAALEGLTQEVRGLREDLTPKMDKPAGGLPPPRHNTRN